MSSVPLLQVCPLGADGAVESVVRALEGAWRTAGVRVGVLHPFAVGHEGVLPGVPLTDVIDRPDEAFSVLAERHGRLESIDAVIGDGALPDALASVRFDLNCRLVATLGGGLVLVADAHDPQHAQALAVAIEAAAARDADVLACAVADGAEVRWLPAPVVVAPGDTVSKVLPRLRSGCTLLVAPERTDVLLGVALGVATGSFPAPGRVLFTTDAPTAPGASALVERYVPVTSRALDAAALLADAREAAGRRPLTPVVFQNQLASDARTADRHIVLPEGTEPRVLTAASRVLATRVARLTLLGREPEIRAAAAQAGVDISGAALVDPATSPLRDQFADTYATLRAKKGMTRERAYEIVADTTYFATMMVHEGLADGLVSGAAHTTADTIRPAFEIIKTAPGVGVVSSVFLMCLHDRVLVFGDCAVNPNPTSEQLADIAIQSADTAAGFGIEPRVAMLSYSTGTSGAGPDVELVAEATRLAQAKRPELSIDGPLQYDAAVVPSVGASKAPGSPVAGRATVLIFPDLSAGNAAYKAVQRSAGALAIGPVLQGLRRPVNDLSRGALVDDIVNTIAVTAIQAKKGATS